jgi:hypothetical protein
VSYLKEAGEEDGFLRSKSGVIANVDFSVFDKKFGDKNVDPELSTVDVSTFNVSVVDDFDFDGSTASA